MEKRNKACSPSPQAPFVLEFSEGLRDRGRPHGFTPGSCLQTHQTHTWSPGEKPGPEKRAEGERRKLGERTRAICSGSRPRKPTAVRSGWKEKAFPRNYRGISFQGAAGLCRHDLIAPSPTASRATWGSPPAPTAKENSSCPFPKHAWVWCWLPHS